MGGRRAPGVDELADESKNSVAKLWPPLELEANSARART
ncbi:MAG: hypothetical protein ACI81L_000711 [Verrucomicrobiales bacterium]|jgi:hypothetical protein